MGPLRIGTCSWKYDSWRGFFYPEHGPLNYLTEYAKHLNTVEIDQWFWSLFDQSKVKMPRPQTVMEYLDSVPNDFRFSIKVPNSITLTHFYQKIQNSPLRTNPFFLSIGRFEEFLKILHPLREQIGVLIFQFEYLNKKKMESQHAFMAQLAAFFSACPQNYPYAVEIRNPNFINDRYFEFLSQNRLHPVLMQGYYMPTIANIYQQYHTYIKDLAVIRLMGRDRSGIEKKSKGQWDQIIDPQDKVLNDLIPMLNRMREKKIEVYLNINNHFEGCAPKTIDRIKERLSS